MREAWLRLSRSDVSAVTCLTSWSPVCLDMLRARAAAIELIAHPADLAEVD